MDEQEKPREPTDDTVHGGEEDPLGGGVADLEDLDDVTEGIPQQD